MALWSAFPFPFLFETDVHKITYSSMRYPIMQGINDDGRAFLAQKLIHNNEKRVGFIIEILDTECHDYEYGLLERLDLHRFH